MQPKKLKRTFERDKQTNMVEVFNLWTLILSLIVVKLYHWIYQWNNPKCEGKLPPGSMGFPIVGKTFEFMKPHDAIQLPTFVKEKVHRLFDFIFSV